MYYKMLSKLELETTIPSSNEDKAKKNVWMNIFDDENKKNPTELYTCYGSGELIQIESKITSNRKMECSRWWARL